MEFITGGLPHGQDQVQVVEWGGKLLLEVCLMVRTRSRWWSWEGSYYWRSVSWLGPGPAGGKGREVITGCLSHGQDKVQLVSGEGSHY